MKISSLFPLGLFVFISVFPVERRLVPQIIFIFTLFCQVDIIIIFILWLMCLRKHIIVLFFLQWMSEKVITNQPNPQSSFLIKLHSLLNPKVSSYLPIHLPQPPETIVLHIRQLHLKDLLFLKFNGNISSSLHLPSAIRYSVLPSEP